MENDTDVLVIGGGSTGTGVARDLAMRDIDVTLVERDALASGTTGHSHGLLHSGARYANTDPASARECIAESRVVQNIAPECIKTTGGYFVQLSDDSDEYFEEKIAACRDAGISVEVLSGEEVRSAAPYLSSDVERAIRVPDGVVNPIKLAVANAADARDRGARIESRAEVVDLVVEDGRVRGATIHRNGESTETIRAEHVVNAAGAWAGRLGSMAGVDIDMRPTKGAMVVTRNPEVDAVINRCRNTDNGDIVVPCEGTAVLGTTSIEVDDPDEYPHEQWEVDLLLEEGEKLIPAVTDEEPLRSYWGVRPLYEPIRGSDDARGVTRNFFLLDHAERDSLDGFSTIVGGKVTTYRRMAEATADHVAETLGVDEPCRTADVPLLETTDEGLDAYMAEFGVESPDDRKL